MKIKIPKNLLSLSLKMFLVCMTLASSVSQAEDNLLISKNFWKKTPSVEKVENAIKKGFDVNAMTSSSYTPLILAIKYGTSKKVIDTLVNAGAEIDKIGHDHRTALFYAANAGTLETLNAILAYSPDLNILDHSGRSPLLYAVRGQNDLTVIKHLINLGLDLRTKDETGRNAALTFAERGENLDIFSFLIKNKIDLTLKDEDGRGLLLTAAYRNEHLDVVKEMRKLTKHIKVKDNNGKNALLVAAERNEEVDVHAYLKEQGINAKAKDKEGQTALLIASKRNTKDIIEFYLSEGLNVNKQDKKGNTPLNLVLSRNVEDEDEAEDYLEIIELLFDNGATISKDSSKELINAIRNHHDFEAVKLLIEHHANINKVDDEGLSPLMVAAMLSKDVRIIEVLLKNNADTSVEDDFGDTALDLIKDNSDLNNSKAVALLEKS